jgi:NADPH:quinone reductase-like Zn-dependent oxidoreductase
MRAAVAQRYGAPEVVRVAEVPTPEPRAGDVLVRVSAAAVTSGDARIRAARFPAGFALPARLALGVVRPRRPILGGAFSGVVERAGARVTGFAPGDEVCGMTGIRLGAHAEYVAVPAGRLSRKPPEVTHDDAAGVLFGGTAAMFFLHDKASVEPGSTVLINGASGAIGTNAVQLAKRLGATVTGVTSSANADLVTTLGADRVIDYRTHDVLAAADRFDIVFDTVGTIGIASGRRILRPGGKLLLAVAGLWDTIRARGDVVAGSSPERIEAFDALLALVAEHRLTVLIDSTYALDDIVDAHRRVDTGHKVGNVIVRP